MARTSSAGGGRKPQPKAGAKRTGAKAPKATAKPRAKKPAPTVVLKASEGIEPKVKMGRPSKYDPAYCDMVVEWGAQGMSRVEIACNLDVVVTTVETWMAEHPDFLVAMTRAKQAEQMWWEKKGRDNLETTGFCQSMWSRSMAARFPKDWREQKQIDHGVTDGLASLMEQIGASGSHGLI